MATFLYFYEEKKPTSICYLFYTENSSSDMFLNTVLTCVGCFYTSPDDLGNVSMWETGQAVPHIQTVNLYFNMNT